MRVPIFPVLAFLVPAMVAAGCAAATGGARPSAESPVEIVGGTEGSLPLFPNASLLRHTRVAGEWYDRGFALTSEGRYEEAVTAYENALAANRSLLNAWYYLGDGLYRLGRYEEALLAFGNATAIDPDFVDAYFYESRVYERLGRPQDQAVSLERALEAADRRKAAEEAGTTPPRATREPVSQPMPLAIPFIGAGVAMVIRGLRRGKRGSDRITLHEG